MRILQIHNSYLFGGGEDRMVQVEAAALREVGDEVIVAHTSNPRTVGAQIRTFATAPWNVASARTIESLIDRSHPDVAHVHNTWYRFSPSIVSALRRRRVPVVMTVHNYRLMCANALFFRDGAPCTDCLGSHPWRAAVHRCYRDSTVESVVAASTISINRSFSTWERGVDRFVVATRFAGDLLSDAGFPGERIRIVPPMIPDPGLRVQAPSSSSTVVYVGRIEEGKGLEMLFEAWRRVSPEFELVVVGEGPLRPSLEDLRVPRTRFLGWVDSPQVDEILLSSRALVFPSQFFETFGLSAGESLAAGLPVVAGSIGTRREVLGEDGAGWLVDTNTVEDWTRTLGELMNDDAVDKAGVVARARYEERFAPAVALDVLRGVYEETLGG